MFESNKLVEKLFYSGNREYTRVDGNVTYLDGRNLTRPTEIPKQQRIIMIALVAVAVVIGIFIIKDTVISSLQATVLAEKTIAENLARPASIESIPHLPNLIDLDDAAIITALEKGGGNYYSAAEMTNSNNLTIYKIPDDLSVADAAVQYRRGIGSLTAADATFLLNGSWSLSVDRLGTTSMVVHYADFSTGDPQIAIQNALAKEGFDVSSITDSGIDDSNNTFTTGTIKVGDTDCIWKISALSLDNVYSISGLPEDSCYVGVRLTKTAEAAPQSNDEDSEDTFI